MSRGVLLKKLSPANQPAGGGLDALGEGDGGRSCPFENRVDMAVVSPKVRGQALYVGDSRPKIAHAQSMGNVPIGCNRLRYGFLSHTPDHEPMDIWSHRENFKDAVKRYRSSAGVKLADVADSIGLKEQTLKDYLYRKDVKPSLEVLQKAASTFGCSVTEFIDDPGASVPPGINPAEWAETSERTRVLASAMFQDLRALPEDEQQIYYELWKKGQEIGRARLAAEAKEKLQAESENTKKPQRR